jgi:GT2 family glycosyltransferase
MAADLVEGTSIDTSAAELERRALFAALLADDPFVDEQSEPTGGPEPDVTAVLVVHNGARWLPTTLAALRSQDRAPDRIVAVDTGSTDAGPRIITRALGTTRLVQCPATTSYGAAIEAGLHAIEVPATVRAERREWVWLLHDDSAPAPDALDRLLGHAGRNPSLSVLGAKAVDWDHPDRLVDIGQSSDAAGRRETSLEPGEIDQGQHDQPRDVLAVGTAGALVRRETWDALHGFDPALPLLREDLDFGWRAARSGRRVAIVPAAEVRHARATLTAQREGALVPTRLARVDRAHGLYVAALDGGALRGIGRLPRLLAGVLVRALVLLLTRRPAAAAEELLAGFDVLGRPGRLLRGIRWRRGQLQYPARRSRPLLSRSSTRLRAALLATTDRLSGSGELSVGTNESGLDPDDTVPDEDANVLRRVFVRPVVGLALLLTLVALVADRHLLHGGALVGGRLLPVDPGASDLWRSYGAAWHDVGTGSASPASPWLPLLALASLPFGGNPAAALTFLLLAAVPLSGISAWYALRRQGLSLRLRWWGAATYALLPVVSETVAAGRFDALVAVVFAPLLLASGARLLGGESRRGIDHAFALGLGLALVAAFAPPVWVIAAVVLVSWVATAARSGPATIARRLRTAVAVLVVAPLLLLPWSPMAWTHPRVLLVGLGGPGGLAAVPGRALGAPSLVLLQPGGHGSVPGWVSVPVILVALTATVRARRSRAALSAFGVAVVALLVGLLAARIGASPTGTSPQGWAGVGIGFAAAALVAAALVAAQHSLRALTGASFGVRQPLVVLLGLAAAATPFVAAGWLDVRGVGGPVQRLSGEALPAVVVDGATSDPGQRVLWLRVTGGQVSYSLGPVAGPHLGDEDERQTPTAGALLAHVVADLASNRGTDAAETLSTFHVRYVAVDATAAGDLPDVLDQQPALSRYALPGEAELWQVIPPSSRVQLLSGPLAQQALHPAGDGAALGRGPTLAQLRATPPQQLAAGASGATATILGATGTRVVVLADAADSRWHATLGGVRLSSQPAWGWAQGFVVPAGASGRLQISYDATARHRSLWLQGLVLLVVLVLAAPGRRRPEEEPDGPVAATLTDEEMWSLDDPELAAAPPAQDDL